MVSVDCGLILSTKCGLHPLPPSLQLFYILSTGNKEPEQRCQPTTAKAERLRRTVRTAIRKEARATSRHDCLNFSRCGQILGRMAKKHLEAEGLLVMNRAWNQASGAHHGNVLANNQRPNCMGIGG